MVLIKLWVTDVSILFHLFDLIQIGRQGQSIEWNPVSNSFRWFFAGNSCQPKEQSKSEWPSLFECKRVCIVGLSTIASDKLFSSISIWMHFESLCCCIRRAVYSYSIHTTYLIDIKLLVAHTTETEYIVVLFFSSITTLSGVVVSETSTFDFFVYLFYFLRFFILFANVCGSNLISRDCVLSQIDRHQVTPMMRRINLINHVHSGTAEPLQYQH